MSRTREIEVYIHEEASSEKTGYWCNVEKVGSYQLKAKLILELPSPKITISEEEFDNAFSESALETKTLYSSHLFRELKSKLFKDAE